MSVKQYDYICIGGGSGGMASARRAAEYGQKVAIIEEKSLGGTCVNLGCVPKKLFWYAANCHFSLQNASAWGWDVETSGAFNWSMFKSKRDAYINRLNDIYASNCQKANIDVFHAHAQFVDNHLLQAGKERLSAPHILISSGSRPFIPEVDGAELGITSDDFFRLNRQPRSIAIIGSGYIACELAGLLQSLGTKVHLIFRSDRPLKVVSSDISKILQFALSVQGVKLYPNVQIEKIQKEHNRYHIALSNSEMIECEELLWATGRVPNTERLGLENTDIERNEDNAIRVDTLQNTNVEGVYAVGDVTNYCNLTPVAIAAGRKLAARLFLNQEVKQDYHDIPSVIFTHPPIAYVGLNEEKAKNQYPAKQLKIYQTQFNPMSRAFDQHRIPTLMKLICLGDEERIIGIEMIGDGADEMLQGFAVAVKMGALKKDFDATVAIHPTSAEELVTLR